MQHEVEVNYNVYNNSAFLISVILEQAHGEAHGDVFVSAGETEVC